jgi:predicted transposase/invertase (TIGR01784 family)
LIHLLNAILDPPAGKRIASLQLLNPVNDKEDLDDELSILDIKARDEGGRLFNVEMQMIAYGPFRARVTYYWSKLHQSQMSEGMEYEELQPTVSICFVNTPLFADLPGHHRVFELRQRQHGTVFTDHLQVHILELAKFTLSSDQLAAPADTWLYFLCHGEELDTDALPMALQFPEIHRAMGEMTMLTKNPPDLERYEARLKMKRDISAALREADREGQKKGHAEGRTEGLKEGKIELIHTWQRLLGLQETPTEQLIVKSLEDLDSVARQLESCAIQERAGG